jgi:heat shock protein HslJ
MTAVPFAVVTKLPPKCHHTLEPLLFAMAAVEFLHWMGCRMTERFLLALLLVLSSSCLAGQEVPAESRHSNNQVLALRDSFWRVTAVQGSAADLADITARILIVTPDGANGTITFSTPSWLLALPFSYDGTNLTFGPAFARTGHADQGTQFDTAFERALSETCCYDLRDGLLTFANQMRKPTVVLSAIPQQGFENRRWHIIKYRGKGSHQTDDLIEVEHPADVTFMNGRVDGLAGCGGWTGTYSLDGNVLTTDVGTILAGRCSSSELEEQYWLEKDLKGKSRIEQSGTNLLLRAGDGGALLLLAPF